MIIIHDIEIEICRAELYPEIVSDKKRSERRLKYILCNYESCAISHAWLESNVEKTKVFRICFKLFGISSFFEVFVNNHKDAVKFLGLLNVSCETFDENIAKIKEELEAL